MENAIELLKEKGFLFEFGEGDFEYSASFVLHEVVEYDFNGQALDKEIYLAGSIKWDGCAHLWYGSQGYLHLCGKRDFERHKEAIDIVWDICSKKIKRWDNNLANK